MLIVTSQMGNLTRKQLPETILNDPLSALNPRLIIFLNITHNPFPTFLTLCFAIRLARPNYSFVTNVTAFAWSFCNMVSFIIQYTLMLMSRLYEDKVFFLKTSNHKTFWYYYLVLSS
jgi:hypothetical protein